MSGRRVGFGFLVPVALTAARTATPAVRDALSPYQYGPTYTPTAGGAVPRFDRRLEAGALDRTGGRVSPILPGLTLSEAELVLQTLYQIDLNELRNGVPPVGPALHTGRLQYMIEPPGKELWLKCSEIWRHGGGDCDDLAAAIAAEWTLGGVEARPVLRPVRAGLVHAIVQRQSDGALFDPSITGGMLRPNPPVTQWRG